MSFNPTPTFVAAVADLKDDDLFDALQAYCGLLNVSIKQNDGFYDRVKQMLRDASDLHFKEGDDSRTADIVRSIIKVEMDHFLTFSTLAAVIQDNDSLLERVINNFFQNHLNAVRIGLSIFASGLKTAHIMEELDEEAEQGNINSGRYVTFSKVIQTFNTLNGIWHEL